MTYRSAYQYSRPVVHLLGPSRVEHMSDVPCPFGPYRCEALVAQAAKKVKESPGGDGK